MFIYVYLHLFTFIYLLHLIYVKLISAGSIKIIIVNSHWLAWGLTSYKLMQRQICNIMMVFCSFFLLLTLSLLAVCLVVFGAGFLAI